MLTLGADTRNEPFRALGGAAKMRAAVSLADSLGNHKRRLAPGRAILPAPAPPLAAINDTPFRVPD
jgi:hypothetical protein